VIWNVPNVLSLYRIAAAPVMVVLAVMGQSNAFLWFYASTLLSDALDGFVARRMHACTELGARLDSWGDFAIVLAVPVGGLLLWPEIIGRESVFIVIVLVSYFVPMLAGVLKYGKPASYHTWGAKVTAVLFGVAILFLFMGVSPWPFRLCVPLAALEAIEEVVMTCMLRKWHTDVPTSWHAFRLRALEKE
jgi:CDP-diacylglycerol--glycerol-3-phosphate 3-phosphatidyltransferase